MNALPCGSVLVVDDEPNIVASIVARLELDGHDCDGVTSGSEAIRLCQKRRYDCMVLDAQLGAMAGLALAERLASSPMRPNHIVIVTGHPKNDFETPLRNGLVDGYLQKPLDVHELAERVRTALTPRVRRHG